MDALTAPPPLGLFREALGVLELPRLLLNAPDLAAQPKGSGQPVVLLPGYGAGDGSTAVDLDAIEAGVADRERIPLQVPVTAIYSKTDGVVAWRACIDSQNRNIEHVEVRTTHLGLGFAPDVYRVIAQRLASSSLAR